MRRLWAIVPILALATACTSSDGGDPSSSPPSPTTPLTSASSIPTSSPPVTSTSPTAPATPTVPADVPTTGPNTKAGEKPPVMPVAATKHTAAGAKAFAKFFMLVRDWGYATMSGAYLRHYSSASCSICQTIADTQDSARKKGHRYVGGRATIVSGRAGSGSGLQSQVVRIDTTAFEEVTSTGAFVTGDPAYRNQDWDLGIRWTGARWLITSVAIEQ